MDIKLAYGKREGHIIHITELDRSEYGVNCNCICPKCEGILVAKLGNKKQWHFAHKNIECNIAEAQQRGLHLLAEEIIRENRSILVPELVISRQDVIPKDCNPYIADKVDIEMPNISSRIFEYTSAQIEKKIEDIVPDAVISTKNTRCIVEVAVTHYVDEDKKNKLKRIGISAFEIDLSELLKYSQTRETIAEAVLSDSTNRKWLFNPLREQKLTEAKDEFRKKYNEEVRKQEQAEYQTIETEKKKQETEKRQQDTIENTFAKEIIGFDFSRQDIQIRDSSGVRWVQCKYCGKITPEYSFSSYGGEHGMNYGICKECYNKPEILEQIKEDLQRISENNQKNTEKVNSRACPSCGAPLKEVMGPYGRFLGCSDYPRCRYSCSIE